MKPIVHIAFFALVLPTATQAQLQTNWWYFGNGCGLQFTSGSPTPASGSAMFAGEGCCTVSNSLGTLLFYSDGLTVYDASHNPMPNGTGLMGGISSTQSCIAVPIPGDVKKYYLFTTGNVLNGGAEGFRYNIIDMSLNGGLGDVVAGAKNILLFGPCSEQVSAVKHSDCDDWWVMAKGYMNNKYYAYRISASGIAAPVITTIGSASVFDSWGQSKFSPDGTKYAVSMNGVTNLFDFDNVTGVLSNLIPLVISADETYGLSFSEDNSKLYVFQGPSAVDLYQYDLSSGIASGILASATHIGACSPFGSMQLARDGKIYIANYNENVLSVINYPNVAGTACALDIETISIPGTCWLGLPNFPDSYFNRVTPCAGDFGIVLHGNSPKCHNENNGMVWVDVFEGLPPYILSWSPALSNNDTLFNISSGMYVVTVTDASGMTFTDSIFIANPPTLTVNAGVDHDSVCTGMTVHLGAIASGGTAPYHYQWSTLVTDTLANNFEAVFTPGYITVDVTDANGCLANDSVYLEVLPLPAISAPANACICAGESITITASLAPSFTWNTGDTTASITVSPAADFMYIVSYSNGVCTGSDSTFICVHPVPSAGINAVDSVCKGANVTFTAIAAGGTSPYSYVWSGIASGSLVTIDATASLSGTETVTVTDANGCSTSAATSLTVLPVADITVSDDTCICEGETVILTAIGPFSCSWNTGETGSSIVVTPGSTSTYIVSYDNGLCADDDTVVVCVNPLPIVAASADTSVEFDHPLTLYATGTGPFEWSPSNSLSCSVCPDPLAAAQETTTYLVSSTNEFGCYAQDEITVSVYSVIHIPNIITPNNDGLNDCFRVVGLPPNSAVSIFNRWGDLLFESASYDNSWTTPTDGVYYYVLKTAEGKDYNGYFHVTR